MEYSHSSQLSPSLLQAFLQYTLPVQKEEANLAHIQYRFNVYQQLCNRSSRKRKSSWFNMKPFRMRMAELNKKRSRNWHYKDKDHDFEKPSQIPCIKISEKNNKKYAMLDLEKQLTTHIAKPVTEIWRKTRATERLTGDVKDTIAIVTALVTVHILHLFFFFCSSVTLPVDRLGFHGFLSSNQEEGSFFFTQRSNC